MLPQKERFIRRCTIGDFHPQRRGLFCEFPPNSPQATAFSSPSAHQLERTPPTNTVSSLLRPSNWKERRGRRCDTLTHTERRREEGEKRRRKFLDGMPPSPPFLPPLSPPFSPLLHPIPPPSLLPPGKIRASFPLRSLSPPTRYG